MSAPRALNRCEQFVAAAAGDWRTVYELWRRARDERSSRRWAYAGVETACSRLAGRGVLESRWTWRSENGRRVRVKEYRVVPPSVSGPLIGVSASKCDRSPPGDFGTDNREVSVSGPEMGRGSES